MSKKKNFVAILSSLGLSLFTFQVFPCIASEMKAKYKQQTTSRIDYGIQRLGLVIRTNRVHSHSLAWLLLAFSKEQNRRCQQVFTYRIKYLMFEGLAATNFILEASSAGFRKRKIFVSHSAFCLEQRLCRLQIFEYLFQNTFLHDRATHTQLGFSSI